MGGPVHFLADGNWTALLTALRDSARTGRLGGLVFDGIVGFFSHFQEKDWVTFWAAVAALAVSAWTWWRNYVLGHIKLLDHQADFAPKWHIDIGRQYVFLEIKNIGAGRAYKIRVHAPADPQHLLGLDETAQGPVVEGQMMQLGTKIAPSQLEFGAEAGKDKLGYGIVIDWVDDYGVPRRKSFTHNGIPREKAQNAYEDFLKSEDLYSGGWIGTATYYDPRRMPRVPLRPWRRFWVQRH